MRSILALLVCLLPFSAVASSSGSNLGLTNSIGGFICLGIFIVAYGFVMAEEFIHLPKSKPVIFAAGLIWMVVAYLSNQHAGDPEMLRGILQHNLIEYASLFLFLLVAMTYINAMSERNIFQGLRAWLVGRGFSYR